MVYAAELDDRRQEVRRGNAAAAIVFWPKIPGLGNVLISSATFTVIDRAGATVAGSASATVTDVAGVARVSCVVDASALALDENYAALITWTYDSVQYVSSVRFDVVLEPWDGSDVSANDLLDEVHDLGQIIDAQIAELGQLDVATTAVTVSSNVATATVAAGHGVTVGMKMSTSGHTTNATDVIVLSSTTTTIVYPLTASNGALADGAGTISATRSRAQHAALLAMKACADVKTWIRSQLEAKGRIYPRLILNREDLRRVLVAQTVSRVYRGQGGALDSPARAAAQDWTDEARRRLAELGEVDYDQDEDRVPDSVIGGWGVTKISRSWS